MMSTVSIIGSCNPQADQKVLKTLFGFRIEKQSEAILLLHENHTLMLLPTEEVPSSANFSLLVFKEEVLKMARSENSDMLSRPQWQSYFLGPKTVIMLKFKLPGGHTIVATTPDGWKDASARAKTINFSLTSNGSEPPEIIQSSSLQSTGSESVKSNLRLFPSLDVKYLSTGDELVPFQVNSKMEVPVETDLFVGKMIFLVRPTDPQDDPFWNDRVFAKKRRRILMLLQGKLKYQPEGPLYAGMEVSDPMKLGLMSSGICSIILKFIQNFDPNLHYSFGDDMQKAHMTAMAESFFDQLIVTPPGEQAPAVSIPKTLSHDHLRFSITQ